jgi:hypothetical protein
MSNPHCRGVGANPRALWPVLQRSAFVGGS